MRQKQIVEDSVHQDRLRAFGHGEARKHIPERDSFRRLAGVSSSTEAYDISDGAKPLERAIIGLGDQVLSFQTIPRPCFPCYSASCDHMKAYSL